jgi:hypothetical protein
VSPLETKQTIFQMVFSCVFTHEKRKKKERKKGMSMVTGTSPVKKKKSFYFISVGAILCLLVQFCAILAVRACAILSLWVPVTGYGCWDMRQPIGVSSVEFVSDRLWLCCVAYILVRILKESVGILWWFWQF